MPKPPDMELNEWFTQLYKSQYDRLLNSAKSYFKVYGKHADEYAEDAVQRTVLRAWAIIDRFAEMESPVGWLYRTLPYVVKDVNDENLHWQEKLHMMSERSISHTGVDFRLKAELESMMTKDEYQLLKRIYIDGYTYKEVSMEQGLSKSALAMRVKRIKERIVEEDKKIQQECEQIPEKGRNKSRGGSRR